MRGFFLFLVALIAGAGMSGMAWAQTAADCKVPGDIGSSAECECPANAPAGRVWGSGPYTADSDICTAARHAGVVGHDGGPVVVTAAPGQDRYEAGSANGVTTSSWGRYGTSYTVMAPVVAEACRAMPDGQESYTCACDANSAMRSVWGSGPYTADSDICTAARHAGAIGPDGGVVTARSASGEDSYSGSTSNGVTTQSWGRYGRSFGFGKAGGSETPKTADSLPVCTGFAKDAAALRCSCAPNPRIGSIWGSGPYTADSDICTAALHAGVIDTSGGDVHLLAVQGLDSYAAATANGVSSKSWGAYPQSYTFNGN